MKCSKCGKKIEETFLGKIKGTFVKEKEKEKVKLVPVCNECQMAENKK